MNPQGRPITVVHSGPTWPVKEWPLERWSKLTEKIAANGSIVIHVGTDFDSARRYVPQRPVPKAINWIGLLNLAELVALLERASIFIGIDSGPLHVATALGLPSVGLFGPTEGKLHVHPRARAVAVKGTSSCLGCHYELTGPGHWKSGCRNDIVCMREITVDQVLNAVSHLLKTRIEPIGCVPVDEASGFKRFPDEAFASFRRPKS
jgi:ADP-heptose:LPS heptosyltransferase